MLLTSLHYWWEFYQMFSIIDLLISLSISVKKINNFSANKPLERAVWRVFYMFPSDWPVTRITSLPLSRQLQPYSLSRTSYSGGICRDGQSSRAIFTWESSGCENAGSCEMVESTEDIRSDYSYGILSDYTDLHWVSLQQTVITNTNYDTVLLLLYLDSVAKHH